MNEPRIPRWLLICYFLAVIIGWGWLGDADYRDQRTDECTAKGRIYDETSDLCIKQGGAK